MPRQIQTARQGTTDFSARDLRALDAAIDGAVLAPGDAGWDEARLAWNLAVDQRPAAVARPQSAADVQAI